MKAQVTLAVTESKRLIGKAVKEHPWVREALEKGIIAIGSGSTNAYVVEELLGEAIEKGGYIAGFVDDRGTCIVPRDKRVKNVVLEKGEVISETLEDAAKRMGKGDVFIKGANALDFDGIAGVMMASLTGGTIGDVLGILKARGVRVILPVGLEKLVPNSIAEASNIAGIYEMDHSDGVPVGIMPVSGEVITEIEAFYILAGAKAVNIGAGGVGGGVGSRTFVLEAAGDNISRALGLLREIRGEKSITPVRGDCAACAYPHCPRHQKRNK